MKDTAVITNAPPNWSGWQSVNQVGCNVGLSLVAGYVLTAARRDGVADQAPLRNQALS